MGGTSGFDVIGQRRRNETVDPDGTLIFVEVTEGLIEDSGHQLHVIVEEDLRGCYRQLEISPGAHREARFDGTFEQQPVGNPVEDYRFKKQREGVGRGLAIVDEISARPAGQGELMAAEVVLK